MRLAGCEIIKAGEKGLQKWALACRMIKAVTVAGTGFEKFEVSQQGEQNEPYPTSVSVRAIGVSPFISGDVACFLR
jgi:hypothetical protein